MHPPALAYEIPRHRLSRATSHIENAIARLAEGKKPLKPPLLEEGATALGVPRRRMGLVNRLRLRLHIVHHALTSHSPHPQPSSWGTSPEPHWFPQQER